MVSKGGRHLACVVSRTELRGRRVKWHTWTVDRSARAPRRVLGLSAHLIPQKMTRAVRNISMFPLGEKTPLYSLFRSGIRWSVTGLRCAYTSGPANGLGLRLTGVVAAELGLLPLASEGSVTSALGVFRLRRDMRSTGGVRASNVEGPALVGFPPTGWASRGRSAFGEEERGDGDVGVKAYFESF